MQFKAFFIKTNCPQEIRRFVLQNPSFEEIVCKIKERFQIDAVQDVKLEYQDSEKDKITFSSDEELQAAVQFAQTGEHEPLLKLWVSLKSNSDDPQNNIQHRFVVCDGCENGVTGYRFKCLTCPDYDLCGKCLSAGLHAEHPMILLRKPEDIQHTGFIRKLNRGRRCGFAPFVFANCRAPPSYAAAGECPVFHAGAQHENPQNVGACQTEAHSNSGGSQTENRTADVGSFNENLCSAVNSFMKTVLEPLGVDATVSMGPELNDNGTKTPEQQIMDAAIQASIISEATRMQTSSSGKNASTSVKEQSADLDVEPMQQTSSSPTDFVVIENQNLEEKIQRSLEHMKAMGFTDDGNWLTRLLVAKEGDICRVLDAIRPLK